LRQIRENAGSCISLFLLEFSWRRGGDSNSRSSCELAGFQVLPRSRLRANRSLKRRFRWAPGNVKSAEISRRAWRSASQVPVEIDAVGSAAPSPQMEQRSDPPGEIRDGVRTDLARRPTVGRAEGLIAPGSGSEGDPADLDVSDAIVATGQTAARDEVRSSSRSSCATACRS